MRIVLTERFQADVSALPDAERSAVLDALLALPKALAAAHAHIGLGLRKLHRSGIWEIRVGLGLRVVFGLDAGASRLLLVGTHDEVRRFLKTL